MNIVALAMSPHRGGNSDTLLDAMIDGAEQAGADVTRHVVPALDIIPCSGCGGCEYAGRCVHDDDFSMIAEELTACDGVMFATPLYFMNVPAAGKALIDRCQSFWIAKHRLGRDQFGGRFRAGVVAASSGAGKGPGGSFLYRGLEDTMTYVFDALGLTWMEPVYAPRADSHDAVKSRSDVLDAARSRGAELAGRLRGGA